MRKKRGFKSFDESGNKLNWNIKVEIGKSGNMGTIGAVLYTENLGLEDVDDRKVVINGHWQSTANLRVKILSCQAGYINNDTIPCVIYAYPEDVKEFDIEYKKGQFPLFANLHARTNIDGDCRSSIIT